MLGDDQEILDLLAREIRDPDLRGRIFALLERDPESLTPAERELVEHTVGGILSAETERLRAETERLRGPWWWLPRFSRRPRRRSDSGAAPPSHSPRQGPIAPAGDDISVGAYLRHLRWIAPLLLLACLGMWAFGDVPLPAALFIWALLTVAVGPFMWLRYSDQRGTPRWWRAMGLALLWSVGVLAVFGIGYALVMAVLSAGR